MRYAAIRASKTGGGVEMLAVISPEEFQHFMGVADVMRAEAREKVEAHFQLFKDRMEKREGITPTLAIREGDRVDAVIEHIKSDSEIGVLVLGAGDREGRARARSSGADRAADERAARADHHRAGLDDQGRHHRDRRSAGVGAVLESFQGSLTRRARGPSLRQAIGGAMFIQTEVDAEPGDAEVPARAGRACRRALPTFPSAEAARRLAARAAHLRRGRGRRRLLRPRLRDRHQDRRQRLGAHQARHPRRDHGAFPVRRAGDRGRGRRGRPRRASTGRTRRSSPRSRSCSTPASARRWPRTAATSPSTASTAASSTCTCRAPAPVARPRR